MEEQIGFVAVHGVIYEPEVSQADNPLLNDYVQKTVAAERKKWEAQQAAVPNWLLGYAQELTLSIAKRCYPEVPQFEVLDDLAGVISQIDNMTSGMVRQAAVEPVGAEACDCVGQQDCTGKCCVATRQTAVEPVACSYPSCGCTEEGETCRADAHNDQLFTTPPDTRVAIRAALDALNVAMDYDGDVFGIHHNNAVDAISLLEQQLEEQ